MRSETNNLTSWRCAAALAGVSLFLLAVPSSAGAQNLAITKSDSPDPAPAVPSGLTYTITVTNTTVLLTGGGTVVDTLPATVTFVSSTNAGCAPGPGNTVSCPVGDPGPLGSIAFDIVVTPTDKGTLTNSVALTPLGADSIASDNTDTETTKIPGCAGLPATILGTDNSDALAGNNSANVIVGFRGADQLSGHDADDTLCGGRGADNLNGGRDKDKLKGHRGKDVLIGGDDDDSLNGGGQRDTCRGGLGTDTAEKCERVRGVP